MAILDSITAAPLAAYGLRKLRSAYAGSAILVRRSSDNAELNIGFDGSGNLDTAALLAFVGSGSGFIRTWYDQSGNGRHVGNSSTNGQPRIVNAGVMHTAGGKPSLDFSLNGLTTLGTSVNLSVTAPKVFTVVHQTTAATVAYLFDFVSNFFTGHFQNGNVRLYNGGFADSNVGNLLALMQLVVAFQAGNDGVYRNGTFYPAAANAGDTARSAAYYIGNYSFGNAQFSGLIGENILFDGAVSDADRVTLGDDQRIHFGLLAAPLSITTSSPLPSGTAGAAYSFQLTASGGTGNLTWSASGLPAGMTMSASGLFSGTAPAAGTYNYTVQVVDQNSQSTSKNFSFTVNEPPPLPYGFVQKGTELFFEANLINQSNNSNLINALDQSANARDLTASSNYPTYHTNIYNGKATARFNGTQNPLANNSTFKIRCGWILANFTGGATFDNFRGLLTSVTGIDILVGGSGTASFFDFGHTLYEFRSNDRIYPASAAPAPINGLRLIFFVFHTEITLNGVQIGRQRDLSGRNWIGDVPLLILCSRGFCEADVRARSKSIADAYGLTLADVFPYQGSKGRDISHSMARMVFKPKQGNRITRMEPKKQKIRFQFGTRRQSERDAAINYFDSHKYDQSFIYRDIALTPPRDVEGYFASEVQEKDSASYGFFDYSFDFEEK